MGLSREQLAESLQTSTVSIYRIEQSQQQPRTALLARICLFFKKEPGDFYKAESNVVPVAAGRRVVPILDFVSAGDFSVIAEHPDSDVEHTMVTDLNVSPDAFGLRVRGRSMEPGFVDRDLLLMEPRLRPLPGDCVVAVNEQGEGTFKEYQELGLDEHGRMIFRLVSTNPAYPTWRSDRTQLTVRATLLEHRRLRRAH